MAEKKVLILGKSYSFTDLSVVIAGVEMHSVSSITANVTQEKTNNYGTGTSPVSRGRGKEEYEVSFDMSMKDVNRLRPLAPSGKLNKIPYSTVVITLDNGDDVTVIKLTAFEFSSDGIDFAQDDTEARRTYDGICANITFNQF